MKIEIYFINLDDHALHKMTIKTNKIGYFNNTITLF